MKIYLAIIPILVLLFMGCDLRNRKNVVYKEEVSRTDSTIIMRVYKYGEVDLGYDTVRYKIENDGNTLDAHNVPRTKYELH